MPPLQDQRNHQWWKRDARATRSCVSYSSQTNRRELDRAQTATHETRVGPPHRCFPADRALSSTDGRNPWTPHDVQVTDCVDDDKDEQENHWHSKTKWVIRQHDVHLHKNGGGDFLHESQHHVTERNDRSANLRDCWHIRRGSRTWSTTCPKCADNGIWRDLSDDIGRMDQVKYGRSVLPSGIKMSNSPSGCCDRKLDTSRTRRPKHHPSSCAWQLLLLCNLRPLRHRVWNSW